MKKASKQTKTKKQRKTVNKNVVARTMSGSALAAGSRMASSSNPIRIKHREMLGTVRNAQGWALPLYPQNPNAFPWLHSVARLFDKYTVNQIKFEYIPSCNVTSAHGAFTMAIDYDPCDTPAATRTELAQMDGQVSDRVYAAGCLNLNLANLQSVKHLWTHYNAQINDPRTSVLGTFEMIVDDVTGVDKPVVGDLYICYDITFFCPQPEESGSISLSYENPPDVEVPLGWTGLFLRDQEEEICAAPNRGVEFAVKHHFFGDALDISVATPGWYVVNCTSVPVKVSQAPWSEPDLGTDDDENVVIYSPPRGSAYQQTQIPHGAFPLSEQFDYAVRQFFVCVKAAARLTKVSFWLYDAVRNLLGGTNVATTDQVLSQLNVNYIGVDQPLLIGYSAPAARQKQPAKELSTSEKALVQSRYFDACLERYGTVAVEAIHKGLNDWSSAQENVKPPRLPTTTTLASGKK